MIRKATHTPVFWLFLIPVLLAFLLVIIIPFGMGVYYSFTDWSASAKLDNTVNFVGLSNYEKSFADPKFLYSFGVTTVYTVINVMAVNILAFALALLVSSNLKASNVYRAGFFVPNLIGGLVLGFVWQFIFNSALPVLGPALGLGFLGLPENLMLANNVSATLALVIVSTWQYAGYIMMIYLAAIQGIPTEVIEASQIDGASSPTRLIRIVVPMVAHAFTVTTFLTLINSFKQFDVNVSLTAGGPSTMFNGLAIPGTQLLAMNIYNTAFSGNNLAQGQARAVVFFLVLVVFSTLQVMANKKKEIEL